MSVGGFSPSGVNGDPGIGLEPNITSPDRDLAAGIGRVTDVMPAWGESLPPWADDFVALVSNGSPWPAGDPEGMDELASAHWAAMTHLINSFAPLGKAAALIKEGWRASSFQAFADRLDAVLSEDDGLPAVAADHHAYAYQAHSFAVEIQYTKISINIAFWVGLTAAYIALLSAFFSAGSTTSFLGPISARTRASIKSIYERLVRVAGLPAETRMVGPASRLASSDGMIGRLLSSHTGREIIEELTEETVIDGGAQAEQNRRGSRQGWDWERTLASGLGGGAGAVIGMRVAPGVSRLVDRLPLVRGLNSAAGNAPGVGNAFRRYPGRVLSTGIGNMITSPLASIGANGLVYGQWQLPDGADLLGAAMGGAGRTNTISPFNPEVLAAVSRPLTSLHEAQHAAD
ncbi:MAG TPA: hypothetical protein VJ277_11875, partial [Gemmatimonadales bacterium]|nr:hypothetical protein [Gemmatimonadales bacterium]